MRSQVLAMLLLIVLVGVGCTPSPVDRAVDKCKQAAKARLKAPGTAEFPEEWQRFVRKETDEEIRLVAWVDAENTYGGEVRTRFSCWVQSNPNIGWDVAYFQFLED